MVKCSLAIGSIPKGIAQIELSTARVSVLLPLCESTALSDLTKLSEATGISELTELSEATRLSELTALEYFKCPKGQGGMARAIHLYSTC